MRVQQVLVAIIASLVVAGCGASESPGAAPGPAVARERLVLIPAVGKAIVTFRGLVNDGRPVPADLASFDALPSQTVTVVEPFLKKTITFTGVGFGDLLEATGATGESVTLHALDDYEVTLDAAVLREPGVMLATVADGEPIDGASGGPVRLIFPESSESGQDSDLWVWSVDQITVA